MRRQGKNANGLIFASSFGGVIVKTGKWKNYQTGCCIQLQVKIDKLIDNVNSVQDKDVLWKATSHLEMPQFNPEQNMGKIVEY